MSTMKTGPNAGQSMAKAMGAGLKGLVIFLFGLSGIINLLALTGAIYMLQIYDRALTSGSVPTLLAISLLAIGLYLFQGVFDALRSQILVRMGGRLDKRIAPMAHRVAIDMPRYGFSTAESLERGRDVDTVRSFLGGQGPIALFDLPWMPLYIAFVYVLHPYLGALTLAGAFVLTLLTILTEILTRRHSADGHKALVVRNTIADGNARNADVIRAMGFTSRAVERFRRANEEHLAIQTRTSDIGGTIGSMSRVLRMLLQSAILGLGAYLTIKGQLSAGAIIAASVASTRALAPVDQAIANWKHVVSARSAWRRLKETALALDKMKEPMDLPLPSRSLQVERVTIAAPSNGRILLTDVDFRLEAGQALGIIGPSGGGKTTLVRGLTGIWPVLRGNIRIDDADLGQWREDVVGRIIGYLPQDVALMDGTIAQNIARFEEGADPRMIVNAARAAGVHEMIVRLPEGYHTELGANGMALSAGQRQRIGLARALFGDPFIVVMDEPNSNLDAEGEAALTDAIAGVRARGGIVVVVAHRPSALAAVDLVGVVQAGKLSAFGPKATILQTQPRPQAANVDLPVEKPQRKRANSRLVK
jgi:PrtD family type I secretion system ABC transporter